MSAFCALCAKVFGWWKEPGVRGGPVVYMRMEPNNCQIIIAHRSPAQRQDLLGQVPEAASLHLYVP